MNNSTLDNVPTDNLHALQWLTSSIVFVGFFLNFIVVIGILKSRKLRGIADVCLNINLSISDLFCSLTWIATQAYIKFTGQPLENICEIQGFVLYLFLASSVFTLIAIGIFHYRAIVWEKGLDKGWHVALVITFIWVISTIGAAFTTGVALVDSRYVIQPSHLYCLNDFSNSTTPIVKFFNYGISGVLFLTPFFLAFCYFMIWKKLHKHKLFVPHSYASKRQSSANMSNNSERQQLDVNVMIIRRACGLSSCFACVFYFQSIIFTYQILTGTRINWLFDAIGASLVSLNTIVNPGLFLTLDYRCRRALLDIFSKEEEEFEFQYVTEPNLSNKK
ncbi:hypothetical protein HDV04_005690 [Boothiomyces sp. JEL0838]|nr:hypothetical protein HDV04_005690 [Boothiomyces sp. JEL0838]